MKSVIVCLVLAAVFVYVSAMPADDDTPAVTTTAPSSAPPSGGNSTAPTEEPTEPSATPVSKILNPMKQLANIGQSINSASDAGFKFLGQFSGTG